MSEETTYSAARVDQLLKCSVCLDRFNSPKILPCQHTFCSSPCLQGLIRNGVSVIKCPECRAMHIVPINGVAGFPTNITIANFLDLPTQMTTPGREINDNVCQVCEQTAVTSRCTHCEKFVCEPCRRSHIGQMKLDMGRLVGQIRRSFPKISNSISNVEQRTEQVKQRVQTVKAEVKNTVERYIKELRDRELQLVSELETFQQGELRSLRMHQETLEVELASMASYCDSTESVLGRSDNPVPDEDLGTMKRQCAEYTEQIMKIEREPIPETRQVRFAFIGESLHENISDFGSVNITGHGGDGGTAQTNAQSSGSELTRRRWSDNAPVDITNIPGNRQTPSSEERSYTSPRQSSQENRLLHRPQQDYTSSTPTVPPMQTARQNNYTQSANYPRYSPQHYNYNDPTSTLPTRVPPSERNRDYMFRLNQRGESPDEMFRQANEPVTTPRMEALMEDILQTRDPDIDSSMVDDEWLHTPRGTNVSRRYGREARSGDNMALLIGGVDWTRRAASWTHNMSQTENEGDTRASVQMSGDATGIGRASRRNRQERVSGLMGGGGERRPSPSSEPWLTISEDVANSNVSPPAYNGTTATVGGRGHVSPPENWDIPNVASTESSTVAEQTVATVNQESPSTTVRARWAGRGTPIGEQTEPSVGQQRPEEEGNRVSQQNTSHNIDDPPIPNTEESRVNESNIRQRRLLPVPVAESFDIPNTPPDGHRTNTNGQDINIGQSTDVRPTPVIQHKNKRKNNATSGNVIIHPQEPNTTNSVIIHPQPSTSGAQLNTSEPNASTSNSAALNNSEAQASTSKGAMPKKKSPTVNKSKSNETINRSQAEGSTGNSQPHASTSNNAPLNNSEPQASTSKGAIPKKKSPIVNKSKSNEAICSSHAASSQPDGPPEGLTRSRTFVREEGPQMQNTPTVAKNAVGFRVDVNSNKKKSTKSKTDKTKK